MREAKIGVELEGKRQMNDGIFVIGLTSSVESFSRQAVGVKGLLVGAAMNRLLVLVDGPKRVVLSFLAPPYSTFSQLGRFRSPSMTANLGSMTSESGSSQWVCRRKH